jgi:hypothetical protein
MAVKKNRDTPLSQKAKDWKDRNFGANEHGDSFAKQMALALPDAYTIWAFTKRPEHKEDFTKQERVILSTAGGFLTLIGAGFMGALPLSIVHSEFYDVSVEPDTQISIPLSSVRDDVGYVAITDGDESFLLRRTTDGEFQLYSGNRERSGDYTFTHIADPDMAGYQAMQIASNYEASVNYSDLKGVEGYGLLSFEGLSAHFQEEMNAPVLIGADEPSNFYTGLDYGDLQGIFEDAQKYFDDVDELTIDDEIEIRDNNLVAPAETAEGMLNYYLLTLGLIGGWGVGGSLVRANKSSRNEYKKRQKKQQAPKPS